MACLGVFHYFIVTHENAVKFSQVAQ